MQGMFYRWLLNSSEDQMSAYYHAHLLRQELEWGWKGEVIYRRLDQTDVTFQQQVELVHSTMKCDVGYLNVIRRCWWIDVSFYEGVDSRWLELWWSLSGREKSTL